MNKCKDCKKIISINAERCRSCEAKRKHKLGILNVKGENNGNYKSGECNKKHYCIDCKTAEICYKNWWDGNKRCDSCNNKWQVGENNPAYIDGSSIEQHYCIECKINEISYCNWLLGDKRCSKCNGIHRRGPNHPLYKDGRTLVEYCCSDCGKEVSYSSGFYGRGRCTSCENKTRVGELSGNWLGGLTFEEYGKEFDSSLKEQVRFRDGYKCQECGCSQLENGRQLDCHHIDYNKKNNILNNLIALCKRCHMITNHNRDYWQKLYQKKIETIVLK